MIEYYPEFIHWVSCILYLLLTLELKSNYNKNSEHSIRFLIRISVRQTSPFRLLVKSEKNSPPGHTKTRITDQRITEHGSRFRYRITCHNYYSMVIFHSAWEPVSRNHFKMAGVCKWAISVTEAYFMDDTRLVGNRMIE